jgi:hypothetical protein
MSSSASSSVKKSFRCAICGATHQQSRGPICPSLKCDLPIFTDFLRRFDEHHASYTSNNSASVRRIFAFLHAQSDSFAEWARANPDVVMPPESLKAAPLSSTPVEAAESAPSSSASSSSSSSSSRLPPHSSHHRPMFLPLPTPPPTVVQAFRLPPPPPPPLPPSSSVSTGVVGGASAGRSEGLETIKGPAPPVLNCELLCRARKVERIVLDPKDFQF